jgi:hypothetical protein
MNPESTFPIRNLIKYLRHTYGALTLEDSPLKQTLTLKQRKEIQGKMTNVFKNNIKGLSAELQRILVDDMTTAFQNRINVLNRAQERRSY